MARIRAVKFIEYSSRREWAEAVASIVAFNLSKALESRGTATLIVPGGTTPGPVFGILRNLDVNWRNVCVIPSDERMVSDKSPRSNLGMIRATLMRGKASDATTIALYQIDENLDAILKRIDIELEARLPSEIALLGMGEDMHTASLFPGANELDDALSVRGRLAMPVTAPETGEQRITLTYRSLSVSKELHILINGPEKKSALQRAVRIGSVKDAPVAAFLANAFVHYAD